MVASIIKTKRAGQTSNDKENQYCALAWYNLGPQKNRRIYKRLLPDTRIL